MDGHGRVQPMVSIVIPAYNMSEFIGRAVRSVLEGSYENVEVICVNDGSTDGTGEVVKRYTDPGSNQYDERVRYFSQPNHGKSVAVNRGIDVMRGEYFALLDADDQLPHRGIEVRVEALESDSNADVAIGGFEVIDGTGTQVYGGRTSPDTNDPEYLMWAFYLTYKTPFHLNACLIRRCLIERVGSFDPYLHRCQDGDYAIRCMEATRGVTTVDESVYLYRKHRQSMSGRIAKRMETTRYRPYVIKKNFSGPHKYVYAIYVILMDVMKMMYEVSSNYTN